MKQVELREATLRKEFEAQTLTYEQRIDQLAEQLDERKDEITGLLDEKRMLEETKRK